MIKKKKRLSLGNYPNSLEYDETLPVGFIKWEQEDEDGEEPEEDEDYIPLENDEA